MGLFDKKYCDVCGEKIGLLGNRKLEDGNLCKNCARKLSPFFSERRSSTVEEIKSQLAYREENERKLATLNPNVVYGNNVKVYVDTAARKFVVTSSSNWRGANPDIIEFSQVISCDTDVVENKDEIFKEDGNGNKVSYIPPRYEVDYEFNVVINVNSPWFSQIELELSSGNRPESRMTDLYREYERQMYELQNMLMSNNVNTPTYAQAPPVQARAAQPESAAWNCPSCGSANNSRFCQSCGTPQPAAQVSRVVRCDKCGWTSQPGQPTPRFCPQCGDPVDFRDM